GERGAARLAPAQQPRARDRGRPHRRRALGARRLRPARRRARVAEDEQARRLERPRVLQHPSVARAAHRRPDGVLAESPASLRGSEEMTRLLLLATGLASLLCSGAALAQQAPARDVEALLND